MAKKRKTSSLNDAAKMTAKQRQQAASRAAGLVTVGPPTSQPLQNLRKYQYALPTSVQRARLSGRPANAKGGLSRIDKDRSRFDAAGSSEVYARTPRGDTPLSDFGTKSSASRRNQFLAGGYTLYSKPNPVTDKAAKTRFSASEKNKSSKTVAKNVKRRER